MSTTFEMFVLIESDGNGHFLRILRSYLTSQRAEQDLELMQQANPTGTFAVMMIEHIDS